jgi:pSer/pThr/pTyr-binding forkhead associated (FHA) protein
MVSSLGLENLAKTAYEAHRGSHSDPLPPWEEVADDEQQAWKAAVSAVAGQTGTTLTDGGPLPKPSLQVEVAERRQTFQAEFIAGRHGSLPITDDYASNQHARFQIAHGSWYVKDLGSTNGTWLNGRRIHAAQRLRKGDKIKIGHTVVTVVSA